MSDLTDDQLDSIEDSLGGPQQVAASKSETCRMLAELRRHRSARAADAERVRSVVREVICSRIVRGDRIETMDDVMAIADRVAEQLAGAVVGLSEGERETLATVRKILAGATDWNLYPQEADAAADLPVVAKWFSVLDRLLASPPSTDHTAALCALLDSDMPAGELRKALSELAGRR